MLFFEDTSFKQLRRYNLLYMLGGLNTLMKLDKVKKRLKLGTGEPM